MSVLFGTRLVPVSTAKQSLGKESRLGIQESGARSQETEGRRVRGQGPGKDVLSLRLFYRPAMQGSFKVFETWRARGMRVFGDLNVLNKSRWSGTVERFERR